MSDSESHKPLLYEIIYDAFSILLEKGSKDDNTFQPWEHLNEVIKKKMKKDTIKNIFSHDLEQIKTLNECLDKVKIALNTELSFYEINSNSDDPSDETNQVFQGLKDFFSKDLKEDSYFLPSEKLEKYLASYYKLFRYLFSDTILLDENIGGDRAVSDFFSVFPGKKGESIYSPYAVESTLKLYKALEDAKRYSESAEIKNINSTVRMMIASVYATKTFRDFRRITIKNGRQYLLSCENTDTLDLKGVSDLSSIEMVKPIRLFGKIKRYINSLKENSKQIQCNIKIIGTVYIEPDFINSDELSEYSPELYDLCSWINNNYKDDPEIQLFQIDVHINENSLHGMTKKELKKKLLKHNFGRKMIVQFHFDNYAEISSKKGLDQLLTQSEALLFFLDCPFLYDNLHVVSHDQHLSDWVHHLPASYPNESLSLGELGAVQRLQNQLNMFLLYRNEKTAHFERQLRERRIEYISSKVREMKKNPDNKTRVYIFISSQSSIDRSEYARTFQIRKEEYNSKEMCLLHFGREKMDPLSCVINDEHNTKIRFSLWNILVNTDPSLVKRISKDLSFKAEMFPEDLASEIFIEFNWKKIHPFSETEFQIMYSKNVNNSIDVKNADKDEVIKEVLNNIIKSYFDLIFSHQEQLNPIILKCMRNSFYNVFFGKISNVFQAIAFNRIQATLESNRSIGFIINPKLIIIPPGEISQEENHIDRDFVSSRRKAYVGVIDNLSKAYPSPTLRDVMVSRMRAAGMQPQEVYDKIITACEQSDYTEDELYQNTIMARSELL